MQHGLSVKLLTSVSLFLLLLAPVGCSGSSDDESQLGIADCDVDSQAMVCISDVASTGSDAVSALDNADGGDLGEMSAGVCTRSASNGGPWSLCVVPIGDGQVVVGRDSGDGLSIRAQVEGVDVDFPLDNASGKVTILKGQTTTFQVVDDAGAIVGTSSGIALTESGS